MKESSNLGISGRITQHFLTTEITPLLALVGLLLGIFAILITPREEEPQINVTFANIFVPFPGASAHEVENLISIPAEQKFSEIQGIEHIYSVSRPGLAILTVQFKVGESRTDAIVRLYNVVYSNQDWLPPGLGVGQPLVKPKGIDDVPILTATLWREDSSQGTQELQKVAHTIEAELKRIKGTREIYTIGGMGQAVYVRLDPQRLAGYGLSLDDLRYALNASNATREAGTLVNKNQEILVQAGDFLSTVEEINDLVVGMNNNAPIYLRDVADVSFMPDQTDRYVWFGTGVAAASKNITQSGEFPAVTIAVGKQPGTNAVAIAEQVIERFAQMRGVFIPDDVQITITRNYGETANAKAQKLIGKLIFATSFVVLLVLLALGWKEAIIVGFAVIITLVITLFASWVWGFTLNRVSLFALIFSIGILVDDAIVVVENIHRHLHLGAKNLMAAIPMAVDEIGGPTILATLTVIAALLPMAFVTGLMGPYMSPIPINASFGMLISLAVAFVFTPWLAYQILHKPTQPTVATAPIVEFVPIVPKKTLDLPEEPFITESPGETIKSDNELVITTEVEKSPENIPATESLVPELTLEVAASEIIISPLKSEKVEPTPEETTKPSRNDLIFRLFDRYMRPFLRHAALRWLLLGIILILIIGSLGLVFIESVVLKMLPFDNKSEFQIVVDMPEGTSLERTAQVLGELGRYIATVEEVTDYQIYAGTAAPINFNGLVRQYYLREAAYLGDIQVNLVDSHHRQRKSHEIALSMREPLQKIGKQFSATVKIVEVPPGPPVLAPLVAEIYGLDYAGQLRISQQIREVFQKTADIIDIDDSVETPSPKFVMVIDQSKAARLGISQANAVAAISATLKGEDVSYLHASHIKYAIPIRLQFATMDKATIDSIQNLRLRNRSGALVPLSEFTTIVETTRENAIYHKDLLPFTFVTGDMAGPLDSPLYGMFAIFDQLKGLTVEGQHKLQQYLFSQPSNPYDYSVKWDGEWQITFETFRDMGIAYGVGMILIYLLVVAQFRSYLVPIIIMAPIPLTIVGVMPGHALLGAQFTATSMIGMIALAGIIVRNSILLVDFISQQTATGVPLEDAVIQSGAVRTKPIILTGLAAMLGALFILDDPIFSGLAVSLIFGIFVSTLLTLVVIPVMYYAFMRRSL